jgi:hypothetical protein
MASHREAIRFCRLTIGTQDRRSDSVTAPLADLAADFAGFMLREGFTTQDITSEHAMRAGLLPGPTAIHLTAC